MKPIEEQVINVLNAGFEKAANSFGKLLNRPISVNPSKSVLFHPFENHSAVSGKKGELIVLITPIIGDVKGRSFLIFSKEESEEIFKSLNASQKDETIKEAFLLEIDNIISAAVIAELSRSFGLEIYGDVPQIIKMNAKDLFSFLVEEAKKDPSSSMVFSNASFQFSNKEAIYPQFAWILSKKIFEQSPVGKTTA
jgi:chemotaxis protein CheY-P-specific phosphatase CheC